MITYKEYFNIEDDWKTGEKSEMFFELQNQEYSISEVEQALSKHFHRMDVRKYAPRFQERINKILREGKLKEKFLEFAANSGYIFG